MNRNIFDPNHFDPTKSGNKIEVGNAFVVVRHHADRRQRTSFVLPERRAYDRRQMKDIFK